MTTSLSILLQAAPGQSSGMTTILMLVAMVVIFYFFMIRPQNKRRKELEEFRNSLSVGSSVITASGVHGTIKEIKPGNTTMLVEIAKGVCIKVDRNYIFANSEQAETSNETGNIAK